MDILTPSDYRSNRRKRPRRKDRPCDACRKKKTRCVTKSGEDSCVHCQLRRSPCTFQHEPPERASFPGETSRGSLGADKDAAAPSSRHPAVGVPSVERGRTASPAHQTGSNPAGIVGSATSGPTPAEASHDPPPKTSSAAIDVESSNARFSLGGSQSRFAELYGLGSDMEPVLMVRNLQIYFSL